MFPSEFLKVNPGATGVRIRDALLLRRSHLRLHRVGWSRKGGVWAHTPFRALQDLNDTGEKVSPTTLPVPRLPLYLYSRLLRRPTHLGRDVDPPCPVSVLTTATSNDIPRGRRGSVVSLPRDGKNGVGIPHPQYVTRVKIQNISSLRSTLRTSVTDFRSS